MFNPIVLFASPPTVFPESPTGESDASLARRAAHDPQAFGELYHRHMLSIYRYHLARTGEVQDAQDLTAQTFLAALESIASYRGGSFLSWLFGIASHKVADHFRHKREHLSLEEVVEIHHPDPLPEEIASQRLQMQRISQALQALTPERAEAVVLRIFGGLSAAEVGRRLGKSEAAAKMLVHRGLSDLQQRLALEPEVEL